MSDTAYQILQDGRTYKVRITRLGNIMQEADCFSSYADAAAWVAQAKYFAARNEEKEPISLPLTPSSLDRLRRRAARNRRSVNAELSMIINAVLDDEPLEVVEAPPPPTATIIIRAPPPPPSNMREATFRVILDVITETVTGSPVIHAGRPVAQVKEILAALNAARPTHAPGTNRTYLFEGMRQLQHAGDIGRGNGWVWLTKDRANPA